MKNSTGNGETKELICTTHGHELSGGMHVGGGVQGGGEKLGSWLVWLSGLSVGLKTKESLVQFPVRVHAWVAGQVPIWEHERGNHTLVPCPLSLLSPL